MVVRIKESENMTEYNFLMKKLNIADNYKSSHDPEYVKDSERLDELAYKILPIERRKILDENKLFVVDENPNRRKKNMTQEIKDRLKELRVENKQLILDRRETVSKLKEFVAKGKAIRDEMKELMAKQKEQQ